MKTICIKCGRNKTAVDIDTDYCNCCFNQYLDKNLRLTFVPSESKESKKDEKTNY